MRGRVTTAKSHSEISPYPSAAVDYAESVLGVDLRRLAASQDSKAPFFSVLFPTVTAQFVAYAAQTLRSAAHESTQR